MAFTTGQPLDIMELNKLADYPKVMVLNMVSAAGGSGNTPSNADHPIVTYDGDSFGTVNSNSVLLQPGEYMFNIPMKFHQSSTGFAILYNKTTSSEEKRAYGYSANGVGAMNNGVLLKKITVTTPTEFSLRNTTSSINYAVYAYQCSITMIRGV